MYDDMVQRVSTQTLLSERSESAAYGLAGCEAGEVGAAVTPVKIAAVFVVLVSSLLATLLPIICLKSKRRSKWHNAVYNFAKYFGSGVILATGLVHLLDPATEAFYSDCLSEEWRDYPYPFALALASLYMTFVLELMAFRYGSAKLNKLAANSTHQIAPHVGDHPTGCHGTPAIQDEADEGEEQGQVALSAARQPQDKPQSSGPVDPTKAAEAGQGGPADGSGAVPGDFAQHPEQDLQARETQERNSVASQLISVSILEFGILFHSVIIGMTLALADGSEFNILFVVIIFHQSFEGISLGTRLGALQLPYSWRFFPYTGSLAYALVTPTGMAVGLGARESLAVNASGGAITSLVVNSISAGILIYTSTVELLAADFVLYAHRVYPISFDFELTWCHDTDFSSNPKFHRASLGHVIYALTCYAAGAGLMAMLGKWA